MNIFDNPLQREQVTKLDAAKRQLDCALKLWFEDGDLVSMHTLVGAAYQIAHDIHKKRGGQDILFNSDFVVDSYRKEFREALRRDFMFFKHADRDGESETMFPPFITLVFVMATIETLRRLDDGRMTAIQLAFTCWMVIFAPDLVKGDIKAPFNSFSIEDQTLMRQLSKREFLEHALNGFAGHTAKPAI